MANKQTKHELIARRNQKLNNHLYKQMMKGARVPTGTSIRDFKAAFHSDKTPIELRILAMATLYDGQVEVLNTFLEAFKLFAPTKLVSVTSIVLVVDKSIGKPHLSLGYINQEKFQIRRLKLTPRMNREVRNWKPMGDRYEWLTKALLTGNAQVAKTAMVVEEIKRALYAIADLILTHIRYNDPLKIYFDYTDEDFVKHADRGDTVGGSKTGQGLFREHLEYLIDQLNQFIPIMTKIGISTFALNTKLKELLFENAKHLIKDFKNNTDEIASIYRQHGVAEDVVQALYEAADALEKKDINAIDVITRWEVIPTFRHYSAKKGMVHRAIIDRGVAKVIKTIKDKITKTD